MRGNLEGKKVVVVSLCSHAGIVKVIEYAVKTFNRSIYMIVGGMHLASADLYPRTESTASFSTILHPSPTYVLPTHRTGWKAKAALEGDTVPTGVAHRVEVVGEKSGFPTSSRHATMGAKQRPQQPTTAFIKVTPLRDGRSLHPACMRLILPRACPLFHFHRLSMTFAGIRPKGTPVSGLQFGTKCAGRASEEGSIGCRGHFDHLDWRYHARTHFCCKAKGGARSLLPN